MADSVLLLPLDSRPVSTRLPADLCRMARWRVLMPPARTLGHLHSPADFNAIKSWFIDTMVPQVRALFVSADLLCYGGLIFSRENRVSCEIALQRLALLEHMRERFPDVPIFATGIVLRDSISVRSDEDFALWEQLQSGRGPYPAWFTRLRERNAAVNRRLLDLVHNGTVDFALIGKEDTAPNNPFRKELSALRQTIRERGLGKKARVINGTDELMALLVARYVARRAGVRTRVFVDAQGSDFPDRVPLYESRPLMRTIEDQIRVAGAQVAGAGKPHDLQLLLHCPEQQQQDLFAMQLQSSGFEPEPAAQKRVCENLLNAIKNEKKMVSLADVMYANGADPVLSHMLISSGFMLKLASWAAWNTASNTTGTVVATSIILRCMMKTNASNCVKILIDDHIKLIINRIADDYIYQTCTRNFLVNYADNPHDIQNIDDVDRNLTRLYVKKWNEKITNKLLQSESESAVSKNKSIVFLSATPGRISLPWQRLFECDAVPQVHFNVLDVEECNETS